MRWLVRKYQLVILKIRRYVLLRSLYRAKRTVFHNDFRKRPGDVFIIQRRCGLDKPGKYVELDIKEQIEAFGGNIEKVKQSDCNMYDVRSALRIALMISDYNRSFTHDEVYSESTYNEPFDEKALKDIANCTKLKTQHELDAEQFKKMVHAIVDGVK